MAYVLEYTRRFYHRREVFRRWASGLMAAAALGAVLAAWLIHAGSQRETLRELLNGPYCSGVEKLDALNKDWDVLRRTHEDLAPYLQLVWSPQHPTNVLAALVSQMQGGAVPGGLRSQSWWMKVDGRTFVSNRVCNPPNMTVRLAFKVDRLNEAGAQAAQQALTNLFDHALACTVSGLDKMEDDVDVGATYKLAAFKTLPVSAVLPSAIEKIVSFRESIQTNKLGVSGSSKDEVSLKNAFVKLSGGRQDLNERFDRALDPGLVIRSILDHEVGVSTAAREFGTFALGKWAEVADARLPWRRRAAAKLLAGGDFIPPDQLGMLVDDLPGEAILRESRQKLLCQCQAFTNAFLATDFHTLDPRMDNSFGTELAPGLAAVPRAKAPVLHVQRLYRKSPGWFRMEMPCGASNLVAFTTWTCTFEAIPAEGGMQPADLLDAVKGLVESGRGYALDGFSLEFEKDGNGKTVRRAEFSGLLPVVYPAAAGDSSK